MNYATQQLSSKLSENRKVNIGVMIIIKVMDITTIPISRKFHDWLKTNGRKGESYEEVIKRLLKPELLQELNELGEESK